MKGGASVQDLVHFLENSRISTFSYYNYGTQGNLLHYNSTTPPVYDLTSVKVNAAIFYGGKDGFADPTDVKRLLGTLPNVVYSQLTPEFEHMDYVWGEDANEIVYSEVVTLLQKYDPASL